MAEKMSVNNNEGVDLISALPDPLLGAIISLLPDNEGVRTCVLSKRWKIVWKHTLHLDIIQSQMLDLDKDYIDEIANTERLINSVIDSHTGSLKSCTIRHLIESCRTKTILVWIKKILELKSVKKLSMEVDDHYVDWTNLTTYMIDRSRDFKYLERDLDFPSEISSIFEALELEDYDLKTLPLNNVSCTVLRKILKLKSVKKLPMEVDDHHVDWTNLIRYMINRPRDFKYLERDLDFPFEISSIFEALELEDYDLKTLTLNNVSCPVLRKILKLKSVKKLSMEVDDHHVDWTNLIRYMINRPRDFKYLERDLNLPFEIFSSFETLELKNYNLKTLPSNSVSCQVLRTLIFRKVFLNNHILEGILSYFFCLENLTLDGCDCRVVKIDSPRLKYLRICKMAMTEIEVFAVNLEIFEIDTVVCRRKHTFVTPKVHVLRSSYDVVKMGWRDKNNLLQSRKVLYTVSNQGPQGSTSSCKSIFENLATLSIDLDLKMVMNAAALFSAFKSCPVLQNLEINTQVDDAWYYNDDEQNEGNYLPYPKFSFWERREFCECINHQLSTLSIKGFTGEEPELEFLKYIITTAEVMKKITIYFVDHCSWPQVAATRCLESLPRASQNLSIILKPGPLYMANVDDNIETWVSTLRDY